MPPKRASKKPTPAPSRAVRMFDADDEEEVDMAHELRVMEENLRQSVAVDAGLRKEQKQKRQEKEFDSQVMRLEAQIDEKVHDYQKNARQNQDAYLDRLKTLLQRKAEVERQIIQHTQELARHCWTTTEEFEAVIQGQSEDVEGAIEDLKRMAVDAKTDEEQARDCSS